MGAIALLAGSLSIFTGCGGGAPKPETVALNYVKAMGAGKFDDASKLVWDNAEVKTVQAALVVASREENAFADMKDWKIINDEAIKTLAEAGVKEMMKEEPEFATAGEVVVVLTSAVNKDDNSTTRFGWMVVNSKKDPKIIPMPIPLDE